MLAFSLKVALFRAKRLIADLRHPPRRWPQRRDAGRTLLAEVSAPLCPGRDDLDPGEARLIAGKIENLRVALRRLDGAAVPADGTFSFWRQIGRATRRAGYVEGRELREGCIVPSVGGGVCQLSNLLYGVALDAGCEIVERHAHSQIVPGSLAESGRDATVFWNYVDLRFRAAHELTIRAQLEADRLIVQLYGAAELDAPRPVSRSTDTAEGAAIVSRSCASCAVETCANHRAPVLARARRTAFLVDAYWPEHDAYIRSRATPVDLLCVPLDGRRFNRPQYAWATAPFSDVRQAPLETLRRSLRSRALAAHGAARQRALLAEADRLATRFAAQLVPDVEHVVVMQSLLPFLWRAGHLGGRTFDVLATGPSLRALHATLDEAARRHPESPTLADFRADEELLEAEAEALARAGTIVTPHAAVAREFGARAHVVPWSDPGAKVGRRASSAVLFAGSTLGRSGAYEMREAARRLGLSMMLIGARDLEGQGFWDGVSVTRVEDGAEGLAGAGLVVLPAFVENRPRLLLRALAAGIPVVATPACGIAPVSGLSLVPAGDADALAAAIATANADHSAARVPTLTR